MKSEGYNIRIKRFEGIFHRYSRNLLLYALHYLPTREEAEDVVQEVFFNFWKSNTFDLLKEEALKTYLFRSVKNNCLNRLEKKDVMRNGVDLLYDSVAEEEADTLNEELIRQIQDNIESMAPQTREIIKLIFWKGMKYQEAADALGVSVNTVKTLLKNGIRHLRDRFGDRLDLFLTVILLRGRGGKPGV